MDPISGYQLGSSASPAAMSTDTNPSTVSMGPDEPQVITFTTPEVLAKIISGTRDDALYVRDVSPSTFESLDTETFTSSKEQKFRLKRYYPVDKFLIITIPTDEHEYMHAELYLAVYDNISSMGLKLYWQTMASKTLIACFGRSAGQGDSSGGPRQPGETTKGKWPTLVIESGYSSSLQALRQGMRWWFTASDHQVKIVLLVKAYLQSSTIIIEKWQERPQPRRPGATTTRAISHMNPEATQIITITRIPGSINHYLPESYDVTSGALRLEFEDLFLRPPGPGEHDIIVGISALKDLGARIGDI